MLIQKSMLKKAVIALEEHLVIAYPTEAVFGLGCDPLNEQAVTRLLEIKQRPVEKGLILIAANYEQLRPYIDESKLSSQQLDQIKATWPGPVTWVMPAQDCVPRWLTGQFESIAVRVTNHCAVRQLCLAFGQPITSTSANLTGMPPCRDAAEVARQMGHLLEVIVDVSVGDEAKPTIIKDALTNEIYRG